jgi:hypothetical protein
MNTTTSNSANRVLRILLSSRSLLISACLLITIGYLLMSGPGSTEQSFNPDIFSTRRIVVAPTICLAGYLLVVVSILRKK